MSIRIGIYDFFAHMLPGVFYLLVAGYGLVVFGFIPFDVTLLNDLSLFAFIILVGAGYIVGLLLDSLAFRWGRFFIGKNRHARVIALEEFYSRYPWVELNISPQDAPILLGVIKANSLEAGMEVERHNVAGIMLRNLSLGLILLAAIYVIFFLVVSTNLWNLVLAALSAGLSYIAIQRSGKRRHWFYLSLFETFAAQNLSPQKWISDKGHTTGFAKSEVPQINDLTTPSSPKTKPVEVEVSQDFDEGY